MLQIFSPFTPILDLVQRSTTLVFLLTISIGDNLFYLSFPLNNGTIQSLDEVLVLAIAST